MFLQSRLRNRGRGAVPGGDQGHLQQGRPAQQLLLLQPRGVLRGRRDHRLLSSERSDENYYSTCISKKNQISVFPDLQRIGKMYSNHMS